MCCWSINSKIQRFPNRNKKKELYEQWVKNCGRLVEPSATSCICSAHFEDKDFNRTLQNTQIREDAIPTLFDPPAHLTLENNIGMISETINTRDAAMISETINTSNAATVPLPAAHSPLEETSQQIDYSLSSVKEEPRENSELCRLCGIDRTVPTERHYKENHRQNILRCTGLDVIYDASHIPQLVCPPCLRKLDRAVRYVRKTAGGRKATWNIPDFNHLEPPQSDFQQSQKIFQAMCDEKGYYNASSQNQAVAMRIKPGGKVLMKLKVETDFSWSVEFQGIVLGKNIAEFHDVPTTVNIVDIGALLEKLLHLVGCPGHTDFPFIVAECARLDRAELLSYSKDIMAAVNRGNAIRSIDCQVVMSENAPVKVCCECRSLRSNLKSREHHLQLQFDKPKISQTLADSKTRVDALSREKLEERLRNKSKQIHTLQKTVERLNRKIVQLTARESAEKFNNSDDLVTSNI